jgi:hypothetical protein
MAARGSNAKKKSKRRRHAKARRAAEIQAADHVAPRSQTGGSASAGRILADRKG